MEGIFCLGRQVFNAEFPYLAACPFQPTGQIGLLSYVGQVQHCMVLSIGTDCAGRVCRSGQLKPRTWQGVCVNDCPIIQARTHTYTYPHCTKIGLSFLCVKWRNWTSSSNFSQRTSLKVRVYLILGTFTSVLIKFSAPLPCLDTLQLGKDHSTEIQAEQ